MKYVLIGDIWRLSPQSGLLLLVIINYLYNILYYFLDIVQLILVQVVLDHDLGTIEARFFLNIGVIFGRAYNFQILANFSNILKGFLKTILKKL